MGYLIGLFIAFLAIKSIFHIFSMLGDGIAATASGDTETISGLRSLADGTFFIGMFLAIAFPFTFFFEFYFSLIDVALVVVLFYICDECCKKANRLEKEMTEYK